MAADLRGRVAVVTGGPVPGIGAAICKALAEEGADIMVISRYRVLDAE
jgi:NAD(P)-dependent dehydrogenase (short-subunit alcohol dehydrogenase family)